VQNGPNWCHECEGSLNKVATQFFTRNAPNPVHWYRNSCFGAFRTVSLLHETRCKTSRTGALNAQVPLTKLRRNFSQRTHSIHPIGSKSHVLGDFAAFHYYTKVGGKQAELVLLMHKFAKTSCVGIFSN
jgi:hypothetical protein